MDSEAATAWNLRKGWSQPNGYRDVLNIGLPLVLSLLSTTVMEFTDRVFLGNYSVDAIAAALPAGIASFLFIAFFMGVGEYTNVFIAQYTGSGAPQRAGTALWQGVYFSMLSAVALAALYFVAEPLFGNSGHPPEVVQLEVTYFRILTLGAGLAVTGTTLATFYSGRGLTRTVMAVNCIGTAVNIPLDYALINGAWGFPELGIAGAGLATVTAWGVICSLFAALIFSAENEVRFKVRSNRSFDPELFGRLMKYGLPGGVQFFLDVFAIAFFVFMVGRLGKSELAATNIAFTINTLAFLPLVGLHIATATLVGQSIGSGRVHLGERATASTVHLALLYMVVTGSVFVFAPESLLELFRSRDVSASDFASVRDAGVVLLRFIALYMFFDALSLVYSGALRGAGDTRFVMIAMTINCLVFMVVPVYTGIEHLDFGLRASWTCAAIYICMLGVMFRWRYRQGKWKSMRVIETVPKPATEPALPNGTPA